MHNLYFDIAATTPLDTNVAELMNEIQINIFGNPSSIHRFGQKSRSVVETSRRQISKSLNCNLDNEITSYSFMLMGPIVCSARCRTYNTNIPKHKLNNANFSESMSFVIKKAKK